MTDEEIAILKYALAREREGARFYKDRTKSLNVPEVKELFSELTQMEMDHVSYVSNLLESGSRGDEIILQTVEGENIFLAREKLELHGISLDSLAGDLSALRMAYLIEKDFEDFYREKADSATDAKVKELLVKLSHWEESHKKSLLKLYDILMKEYWSEQNFEPLY